MATIGSTFYDLIDLFKSQDDKRQFATIIEMLKETNAILDDAMTVTCNQGTNHLTTIRTGLPAVTWGKLYKGIPQSKSERAQVTDTTGFVEGLSTIDKRLLDIADNKSAVRLSEAKGFLESLSQSMASTIFYGDATVNPERFTGLTPRFNDLGAPNGGQIVDGGGESTDNTSVWFVGWGDETCHMIHPKGTPAGLAREDKGEQRVIDGDGNPYYAVEELFRWHNGLSVRDWRYVARIANIDVSNLRAGTVDIYALMRQAFWKLRSHRIAGGKFAIYCNADVLEALDAASTPTMSTSDSYVRLRPMEVDGKEVLTYRTMPLRQCDAILNTEARVVDSTD